MGVGADVEVGAARGPGAAAAADLAPAALAEEATAAAEKASELAVANMWTAALVVPLMVQAAHC